MAIISKRESVAFEDEKALYHYTSIQTAIEHIFTSNMLRLSPITSASDPMESDSSLPNISSHGYEEDHKRLQSNFDSKKIALQVREHYQSLRQLCLCRNEKKDYQGEYTGAFEPIDYFGFAKPRMWDQYGDNYQGVCIALSRNKLENQLSSDYKVINIRYAKNNMFKPNIDSSTIDLNKLEELGESKYLKFKKDEIIKKISSKHNDYRDENECKIVFPSEKKFHFINIQDCIQGIFVTNKLHFVYRNLLEGIASNFKIPLVELSISRNGMNHRLIGKKKKR